MKKNKIHILKPKQERTEKKYKIDLIKLIILIFIIFLSFAILYKPLVSLLDEANRQSLKQTIIDAGPIAHIIYILVVAVQVVLSFIPTATSMTLFGGFVFGPVLGTIYTLAGTIIGSTIAFYLGRRYGRPILEDFIDPETLHKFDKQSEKKGLATLLLVFLIPFTPDNTICLVAGTTKMRIKSMVAVAAIGRLPGTLVTTMIGAGLGSHFSPAMIITITVITALIGLAYVKRKELEEFSNRKF